MKEISRMSVSTVFIAVLVASIFVMEVNIVSASDYPIIKVACSGCYGSIEEAGIFYADVNKTVTFVGSATSDYNIVSQEWRTESGLSQNAYLTVVVPDSGAKYVFTAKDSKNRINSKTIEVQPRSQNICLSGFQISVSDNLRREEWAAGDTFYLEITTEKKSCVYNLKWETKSPYVEIGSPFSKKTQIKIKEGINTGTTVIVKLTISNELGAKEEKIELKIVSNDPPQVEAEFPDYITSFGHFYIDCSSSKEGNSRYENADFISKCAVSFADGANNTVIAKRGESLRKIRVYTGESGIYSLIVAVEDSHGKTSTKNYSIPVFMGTTGKDPIRIYAPNETYCLTGRVCKIDAQETQIDDRVTSFSFFLVLKGVKGQLRNDNGDLCSGPVCSHTFNETGNYTVEIQGHYFQKKKTGSKTVTVIVRDMLPVAALSQTPAKTTVMPVSATPKPTFPESIESVEWKKAPKKSPSMEIGATIFALLGIWVWRKKIKKF